MERPIDKVLSKLSIEEIAIMVNEFNNETICQQALIRKIAAEVFQVEVDKTSIMQMQLIVVHCAIYMSKFILND